MVLCQSFKCAHRLCDNYQSFQFENLDTILQMSAADVISLSDFTSKSHLRRPNGSFTIVGFGSLVARGRFVFSVKLASLFR